MSIIFFYSFIIFIDDISNATCQLSPLLNVDTFVGSVFIACRAQDPDGDNLATGVGQSNHIQKGYAAPAEDLADLLAPLPHAALLDLLFKLLAELVQAEATPLLHITDGHLSIVGVAALKYVHDFVTSYCPIDVGRQTNALFQSETGVYHIACVRIAQSFCACDGHGRLPHVAD